MKSSKIFAIALAALTMTACSDDDNDFNTAGDVTVSMQKPEMSVSEDYNGTFYNIPVVIEGDANGPIKVTVEVSPAETDPAIEEKDYVITQKTITIPSDSKIGYIEFHPVGDNEENPDRVFTATITSAEGATIGSSNKCRVILLDNERLLPEAYAKVIGIWSVECDAGTYPMAITGFEEGEEGYLTNVVLTGWHGQSDCSATAGFSLDASTGKVLLTLPYGQVIATKNFTGYGRQDVQLIGYDGTYIYPTGQQTIESNENVTQFVFSQGVAGAFNSGGWAAWFTELDLVMTKVQ